MKSLEKLTLTDALRTFHEDEDGIETMQVVMILGIAAIVLIVLWNLFPGIKTWVTGFIGKLKGVTPDSDTI